jgi:trehalose 6-phosphate phosphatase
MNRTHSDHPVTDARQPLTLPLTAEGWADGLAVFLDVDGTLLEIAGAPDEVLVPARLLDILDRLHRRLGGAVALISGRRIAGLDRLLPVTGLPAAGLHGLERRRSDGVVVRGATEGLPEAARRTLADLATTHRGVLIEDKGVAVAVHYRAAPEAEAAVRSCVGALMAEHAENFELLDGKMVLEIRPRGRHKGDAVASFMAEPPFRGRQPVFVGDDVTDEDGFEAVNRLGGWSVRVGDAQTTHARFRLADVSAVIDWLDRLAGPDEKEMQS